MRRGLYVGRFQPFHLGHLGAVERILKEVDELVIVIGSAQYSHTMKDPFTAGERIAMVRKALIEAGTCTTSFWIVPVPDVHLHMLWVPAIEGYTPHFTLVFSNEPLTRRLFGEAGYKVEAIDFIERHHFSSTHVREQMIKGDRWENLVPKSVVKLIKDIDGINRLRDLASSDRV